ncbi:MAG: 50S ribosomal protein L3 [bacterium]|nr:50S ribosomal protein L3 [bacterium]
MSKFILGTKQYMTQVFDEAGRAYPVTLLSAGPVVVTQVKSKERDGYDALQVGYGIMHERKCARPQRGHLKDLDLFRHIREWRLSEPHNHERGAVIDVSLFEEGEKVDVVGISKGKGFQGVVKRHGFAGGRRSHGQKHSEREPGSIGGGGRAGGRVVKGMRMGGRMGSDRVTVKNLTIIKIDKEQNLVFVRGAVPGKRGDVVEIKKR